MCIHKLGQESIVNLLLFNFDLLKILFRAYLLLIWYICTIRSFIFIKEFVRDYLKTAKIIFNIILCDIIVAEEVNEIISV